MHFEAVFGGGHLGAFALGERGHFRGVVHGHHAHAIGARIRLDDDIRFLGDAVFAILPGDLLQDTVDRIRQRFLTGALLEIDAFDVREVRIDHPRIDLDHLRELLRDVVITGEVRRFAANGPAGMQRRQQILLVQIFQHGRNAARQVVVQQDRARVEILQAEAPLRALERFEHELLAVGQRDRDRPDDAFVERAETHVQAGLAHDRGQTGDILQVERVARVALGDHQQVLRVRADLFDRRHRGLHGERQHFLRQIVEGAGKQIGVDRRELEARVTQVDRTVERRRVLLPFEPEPAFDGGGSVEDLPLEVEQRAV